MGKLVELKTGKSLAAAKSLAPTAGAAGCASRSCGAAPGELPPGIADKVRDHPCYSEEAHHFFARMHVAVAPGCNIQCNYCNRKYDCANESRPGVVSERLTPEEAARKLAAVASRVPQLSVLGIAGPGDACHDWAKTRRTFELALRVVPDLKLCLSTNGLALPEHVEEIARLRIDHVTITINAIDPEIGAQIYAWVAYRGKRHRGVEAAKILLARQLEGLDALSARGILVKVNSVLIPGVNDAHLAEVNREVRARGAFLHNVMPLISDPAHGTRYGLDGQRGPTHAELQQVQDALGGTLRLMRHCRQCRADAVGLLGEDRGSEFALKNLPEAPAYDPTARAAYREIVAGEREERSARRTEAQALAAGAGQGAGEEPVLVAVATQGGGRINQHFGHARELQIFEASPAGIRFIGHRKLDQYCEGGFAEAATLGPLIAALAGVAAVLCAKVGDCPRDELDRAGLEVTATYAHDWIESGVAAWYAARCAAAARCANGR